jgi:hypothetical protein
VKLHWVAAEHTRSDVYVRRTVTYSVFEHAVSGWHTESAVAPSLAMKWVSGHTVRGEQILS